MAATRKLAKYSALGTQYMTSSQLQSKHWVLYESACEFLNNRGRKIGDNIGRLAFCFNGFLFRLTQRFNTVLLNDSFILEHHLD